MKIALCTELSRKRPRKAQECAKAHSFLFFFSGKEAQHENRTLYGIKECRMV